MLRSFDRIFKMYLMYDETIFKLDIKHFSGQKYHSASICGSLLKKFKYVLLDKFVKKVIFGRQIAVAVSGAEPTRELEL